MRGSIAVLVVLAVGCEKKAPRYEGPMRVDFGDCAIDASWSSGPRPTPPSVKKSEPLPTAGPPVAVADPKASKDTPDDPALARQQAIQQARDAGILGPTQLVQGGAFASLTGTGDISGGFDDSDIYGGLLGSGSGGGTGWGTIGTGRYGTIGRGTGTGGYGVGRGGMRGRTAAPTISIGQPNANGDLDKAIIRRYIKRNIQKLQYCYEKQLLAKPALAGTVNAQFFIDPNGSVASSSASGVDPEVSGCVASVIKSIEFPKPKGGGGVQVNYPFTFRPANTPTTTTPSVASTGVSNNDLGAFTADEVNRVVKSRLGVFRACYQKEQIRTPGIGGKVVVKFKIAEDGSVASAAATSGSTLSNVAVNDCLLHNISRLKFPPKGVATVTYPFVFAAAVGSDTPDRQPTPPKPAPVKPAPSLQAYRPGAANPLIDSAREIEECLRGNSKPYGAAVVGLDWGATGVTAVNVSGVSDDVAVCMVEVAKKIPLPKDKPAPSQRCSIAFGRMPIEEIPGVDVTAATISYGGAPVAQVPVVMADQAPTFKIEPLFAKVEADIKQQKASQAPVSIDGPIVIRAADATPTRVINKVINTVRAAGGDFVLAASAPPGWRLLNLVDIPVVPVPRGTGGRWSSSNIQRSSQAAIDDERVVLSVLVQKDRTFVGISRINEFYEIGPGADGLEKLEKTLRAQKASAFFGDRSDAELAGEDVTYGDLVAVIDVLIKTGFVDFSLTDPAGLTARPTL